MYNNFLFIIASNGTEIKKQHREQGQHRDLRTAQGLENRLPGTGTMTIFRCHQNIQSNANGLSK
jgi:hypothetical protein